MKQPHLLTLQEMYNVYSKAHSFPSKYFFKDGFGVCLNMSNFFQPFINKDHTPCLLGDYRFGYVKKGSMRGIINLQEYRITAGQAAFVTPGTIVEPLEMSDDLIIEGMGVPSDMFHLAHSGKLPELLNGKQKNGILAITEQESRLLDNMFIMLCETCMTLERSKEEEIKDVNGDNERDISAKELVINNMIVTITSYYNSLFAQYKPAISVNSHTAKGVFDRFIQLVNTHCAEQRQLSFYADKICLTERYLGTVIRQTSGITAKEWIDKAVITAAKVKLRHENSSIANISEQLHFANPSFFCKYFKRLVGCTPQEYRDGVNVSKSV